MLFILTSLTLLTWSLRTRAQCLRPPAGILAWLPGDGDSTDIAGSNDGSLVGDVSFATGKVAQAFAFDGTTGYVDLGDTLDTGLSAFTLEAWINGDPTMESWGRILDKGFATGYALGRREASNKVSFEFLASGSQGNGFSTTSDVIDNNWHHVAVTVENGTATIYADGVAENNETVAVLDQNNTLPLYVGYNPGEGTRGHWKGLIDEVSIYQRALSANEIKSIFRAGSRGKCKGRSAAVAASPHQIGEGENASYRIALSEVAAADTRVKFTMSGDAVLGTDYTLSGAQLDGNLGRVTIPAGESSALVTLTALDDDVSKEVTAIMTINRGRNYVVAVPNKAKVKIVSER